MLGHPSKRTLVGEHSKPSVQTKERCKLSMLPSKEGWKRQLHVVQEQVLTLWQTPLPPAVLQPFSTDRAPTPDSRLAYKQRPSWHYCCVTDAECQRFTPPHSGNEGQLPFSSHLWWLSAHQRPVASLNVADLSECLTICSVLCSVFMVSVRAKQPHGPQSISYLLLLE